MDGWFEKLIDAATSGSDTRSLKAALQTFTKGLGFDRYAYFHLRGGEPYAVSDYAQEWQHRYVRKSYWTIDPVVIAARRRISIFSWAVSHTPRDASKALAQFNAEAAEFGICSGVSLPVATGCRSMTILTLATSAPSACARDFDPIVAAAAVARLHTCFAGPISGLAKQKKLHLRPRELVCLRWAADGKSIATIARIEGVSLVTVQSIMQDAKSALGSVSLRQATETAKLMGLI